MSAAIVGLLGLAMAPPASGEMLLVPLAHEDANAVARLALASGAQLLGGGPLPGSLVVVGDRSRIAGNTRWWSMLIVAAPPAGCGATATAKAA